MGPRQQCLLREESLLKRETAPHPRRQQPKAPCGPQFRSPRPARAGVRSPAPWPPQQRAGAGADGLATYQPPSAGKRESWDLHLVHPTLTDVLFPRGHAPEEAVNPTVAQSRVPRLATFLEEEASPRWLC